MKKELSKMENMKNLDDHHVVGVKEILLKINNEMICESPGKALLTDQYYTIGRLSIRKFDLYALISFPLIFILFNFGYWIHYWNK